MRRSKLSKRSSKRNFRRTASRVHRKNGMGASAMMRGGIRL